MNFGNLDMYIDGEKISASNIGNWKQTMHMYSSSFTTSFEFKDKATISCTICAPRNVQYAGYFDIKLNSNFMLLDTIVHSFNLLNMSAVSFNGFGRKRTGKTFINYLKDMRIGTTSLCGL